MAQYKGILQGQGKPTQKFGTKNSGLYAEVNGWDIGGLVKIVYNAELARDEVILKITTGSNGTIDAEVVATFILNENGRPVEI